MSLTASALHLKLTADHAALLADVRAWERERAKITLLAHGGDAGAKKRLRQIRSKIEEGLKDLSDLMAAIGDLEPRMVEEKRLALHATRTRAAAEFSATVEEVLALAPEADKAVLALAVVFAKLQPLVGVAARFVQNCTLSRSGHERRANIV